MIKFELDEYHRKVPDDELLSDLRLIASNVGTDSISAATYGSNGGKYSGSTLGRRFGGWNKALVAAGLPVLKRHKIPDEEMFANLESVWRHLGRQPRYAEVCRPTSLFAAGSYENRFGSWRKSLKAFVSHINLPADNSEIFEVVSETSAPTDISGEEKRSSRHINWRTRFIVMRRDDFKCQYCGRSPANNPGLELHIDHVKAYSKNGQSVMENLRTACNVCNIGKSDLEAVQPCEQGQ